MRVIKTVLMFAMTSPLNLSLWSVSNFPNQLYYCMTLIISWLKGWMNGGLHSESESLSKLYLCEDVCLGLCDCACSACLWMHVCNCVWSKPAVAGLWIRSNTHTHTHTHIVTPDQTYAYTHNDCHWTELEGPNRVWLWSSPQHPLLHSNTAFLLLCLMSSSWHLPWTQVTTFTSSNRAQCGFKYPPDVKWDSV